MHNWKKNVTLFMVGQGLSIFGSMMVHYAVMWHITLKTQSGVMMTLLTIAGTIPMFLSSPLGGVWADRFNKKYLINIADGSIAIVSLIMAILFSVGIESIALLLMCLVIRSFGQGIQNPAVSALIPLITPEEKLVKVNGINGSIQSLAMFASPIAGAAILALAPIYSILYIDVVTATLGIVILLFFVKTPKHEKKESDLHYFHDIKEGLGYIKGHAFVRKFLVLAAFYYILISPVAIMTPLQVARNWGADIMSIFHFGVGAEHRLAIIEVTFSIGMILGGAIIGAWGGFKNKSYTMGLGIALSALGTIGLGLLTNFWFYSICMGLNGVFAAISSAPIMAMIQTNVESNYMGRVFSVLTMISCIAMPIAMLVWGPLGDIIKIDWLLIGSGIALFAFSFISFFDKVLLEAGRKGGENHETI